MVGAVGYHEDGPVKARVQFVSLSFRFLLVVEVDEMALGIPHLGAVLAIAQAEQPQWLTCGRAGRHIRRHVVPPWSRCRFHHSPPSIR